MILHKKTITNEHVLYFLAFGIALGLRFTRLGEMPLSNFEAEYALQSWYAVQGTPFTIGSNPSFFSLTWLLFYLFPDTTAVARFWPALGGSILVLLPYFFRQKLCSKTAIIIAFGLAMDPGMVTLSRLAGGPMLAICFFMLAIASFNTQKHLVTIIFGGLALISGPTAFTGLVGLLITLLIARIARLPRSGELWLLPRKLPNNDLLTRKKFPLAILVGGGTVLLTSTLFLQYPAGIEGFGRALEHYLRGWTNFSGTPALQPLVTLVAYQPLAVVFAIVAVIRGWLSTDNASRWLGIWLLVVVLLSVFYPGRQVGDIAWGLIPLWILAAKEITHHLKTPDERIPSFVLGGIVFVLCVLFWLMSLSPAPINLTWIILVIVPLLILLTTVLVGLGWSWDTARSGSIWGLMMAASLYVIAGMIGSSQLRFNHPEELWTPSPGTVQAGLLDDSLSDLGLIQNGRKDWLDIISTVDQPSLKWILKKYSNVRYVSNLDLSLSSPVIITTKDVAESSDFSGTKSYLGQDFVWSSKPGWMGVLPPDWWRWVLNRQAPIQYDSIVLWASSEFFPDQPVNGSADPNAVQIESEEDQLQEESIDN